jgi:LysM repeat protein
MKILKIFGLVVGIHVIAFMFVFAIPGCRSTRRHSPPRAATEASPAASPAEVSYPSSAGGSPIASSATASSSTSGNALNPPLVASGDPYSGASMTPAPTVHFNRSNPTRPGTAASAAPAAGAPAESTPGTTYTVGSGDNLWKIAKKHQVTVKELAAANNLRQDAPLRPGQQLQIPGKAVPSSTTPTATSPAAGETVTYKVRPGDSLAAIAKRAGTTPAAIKSLNKLKNDTVRAGQDLLLPPGSNTAAVLAATPEPEAAAGAARAAAGGKHIIKPGETFNQIARRYGVTRSELAVANNIANPQSLRPGQELIIPQPKGAKTATPESPAGTTAAPAPVTDSTSPIAAPAESSPIAPPSTEVTPPVIQVEDSNPIAAPKS